MQDQPNLRDVEAVLDRLDQSWQEVIQVLQQGQSRPSSQIPEPVGLSCQGTAAEHQEGKGQYQSFMGEQPVGYPDTGTPRSDTAVKTERTELTLEHLSLKGRRQKFINFAIFGLMAVMLSGIAFLINQTQLGHGRIDTGMLIIRGKDGVPRAKLAELNGQLSLFLLDDEGKTRAQVAMDSFGNPNFCRVDEPKPDRAEKQGGPEGESLLTQVKEPARTTTPEGQAPTPSNQEMASNPVTAPENAIPQTQTAAPALPETSAEVPGANPLVPSSAVKYVGSRTSNKYHYPECKWAKTILPDRLVTFKSVKEAKARGYIRCPGCKPPMADDPPF